MRAQLPLKLSDKSEYWLFAFQDSNYQWLFLVFSKEQQRPFCFATLRLFSNKCLFHAQSSDLFSKLQSLLKAFDRLDVMTPQLSALLTCFQRDCCRANEDLSDAVVAFVAIVADTVVVEVFAVAASVVIAIDLVLVFAVFKLLLWL